MARKNRRAREDMKRNKRRDNTRWGNIAAYTNPPLNPNQFTSMDQNLDNSVQASDTTTGAY